MALSLEQSQRIEQIRAKVLAGNYTLEELKEGMSILRADRVAAATGATKTRAAKAAAKAPINTANILDSLRQGLMTKVHDG